MTDKKVAKKAAKKARTNNAAFTNEERAAARERVQELKSGKADGESALLAKIATMTPTDRALAERLHAIVKASAPSLSATTWYGMPAYAREGKVVCFFQDSRKFNTRYATLGFSDKANLDVGRMWPTSYALTELTADEEAKVATLVRKAAS